jgi:hypothetical protein
LFKKTFEDKLRLLNRKKNNLKNLLFYSMAEVNAAIISISKDKQSDQIITSSEIRADRDTNLFINGDPKWPSATVYIAIYI